LLLLQTFSNVKDTSAEFVIDGTVLHPTSIKVRTKMVGGIVWSRTAKTAHGQRQDLQVLKPERLVMF
jgi:hypothetical protein